MSWQKIWTLKGAKENIPLHHYDGFEILSEEDFTWLAKLTSAPLNISDEDNVLEIGCGAGAYLSELSKLYKLNLNGIDYSPTLIQKIRSHLDGNFICLNVLNNALPFMNETLDLVMSFGVFMYFETESNVLKVLNEMDRVCKPGGKIFVGEVSDYDKQDLAKKVRFRTHNNQEKLVDDNPDHLYIDKKVFFEFAQSKGYDIQIMDGADLGIEEINPSSKYRFYVYITKS